MSFKFIQNFASLSSEYQFGVSICYATSAHQFYPALLWPDLHVDEVLTDDGLPLRGAGLVEGPRLLLRPGHVLRGRPAQDRADDVLVPFVYCLKLSSRVTFKSHQIMH